MNVFSVLKEIEFYEAKQLYRLADRLTSKLVKTAYEARESKEFQAILSPIDFQAQINFMNEVCPDIMNAPQRDIQQFENYKQFMLDNMKQGKKPQQIAEDYYSKNYGQLKLQGAFRTCFAKMYQKLTGKAFSEKDAAQEISELQQSQGVASPSDEKGSYNDPENYTPDGRQINPM